MSKIYKIPIYIDGDYYDSLHYSRVMLMHDIDQILEDAMDMMYDDEIHVKDIYVSTNRFRHIAVFVKSD